MRVCGKTIRKIAVFLICATVAGVHAEVKLRIYMQDGTLQAGNLVSETTESFVILTKEGRLEVPKKRIMFVNGKTLQQWEARPDKLFSTEIIPSEIPNPAFVNDRAREQTGPAIPALGEMKSVLPKPSVSENPFDAPSTAKSAPAATTSAPATTNKPLPKSAASPMPTPTPKPTPTPAPSSAPTPTPAPTPGAEKKDVRKDLTPAPGAGAATASSAAGEPSPSGAEKSGATGTNSAEKKAAVVTTPREEKKAAKKAREKQVAAKEKPVIEGKVTTSTIKPAPVPREPEIELSNIVRPSGFRRTEMGDYHYRRGMALLSKGERGRAIQEFHMAVLLDRRREEPVYELGRLYKDDGQFDKAEKYFAHPILRKKEEIKNWVTEMDEQRARKEKQLLVLNYGTGASLFLTLVFFGVFRRVMRKRKAVVKQRVITADNAEELGEILQSPILTNNRMKISEPVVAPAPPKPIAPPPPFAKAPEPVAPAPIEVKKPEPVAPPPPALEPVAQAPASAVVPSPEPVVIPEFRLDTAPLPSVEEVLAAATLVDEAMQKGNAYAMEGQPDKARREYRTALALNPAHLDAHLGLAYLNFAQEKWDLALEHYVRGLQINPSSADVHYGLGRVLLELGREDEAVPRFQAALRLDPTFDDARECLTSLGKAV